jgi:serine phosphatase RsbU (regulator of sigma subunit)
VFFGEKRLLEMLNLPETSAGRLLERIEGSLSVHIGAASQFDDITMLALRRGLAE